MEHIATIKNRRVVDIQAATGDLDGHVVVQGNAGIDTLTVKTDNEWRGYPAYSIMFKKDGVTNSYPVALVNGEASILIPTAMLESAGKLRFALKGLDANGVTRILTEERNAFLTVAASGPIDGSEGHEDELTELELALQHAEELTVITCDVDDIVGGHRVTITDATGAENSFNVMNGEPGQPGRDGTSGRDGVSPTASVSQIEGGARITVTDANGTTTADLANGADGRDGTNGRDGVSPTASVTQTASGATVTVTDANGTTTADLTNGPAGSDGQDGSDGITPTVTVTNISGGHRVSFSYGSGDSRNTYFDVMDGTNGTNGTNGAAGADGITPTITVNTITGGHRVSFSYGYGDYRNTYVDIMDGTNGTNGTDGDDYVITQADYAAIAQVVYGMLTNADTSSY